MTELCRDVIRLRRAVQEAKAAGKRVALAPTMGAFHQGHLELIRRGRREGYLVVSIFVNPTQFGPGEGWERYPRDLEGDLAQARREEVDLVFAPPVDEMYPAGDCTWVEVAGLSDGLCGRFRPGHFQGVATVVCKLFNLVGPEVAVFGEKDYQQLQVIRRMTSDLRLPVEIVSVPTVREADGLAMSSRNRCLQPEDRRAAAALYRGLCAGESVFQAGERRAEPVLAAARSVIAGEPGVRLQYLELVDAETLSPVQAIHAPAALAVAALVGGTRLIDNVIVGK